jgi:hypothetical protein
MSCGTLGQGFKYFRDGHYRGGWPRLLNVTGITTTVGAPFLRVLCEGAGTTTPAAAKLRHPIPKRNLPLTCSPFSAHG